jgi:5-methylcytosine-specific restriction endonuclease McrA
MGYEPINVVSWKRAFCMVFAERALVVEEYEQHVKSPSSSFRAPSVVRLCHSVKRYRPKLKKSKRAIFERDHFTCQYCGGHFSLDNLTVDHVFPKSSGGDGDWSNAVTACKACNNAKGNKTPQQAGMVLIRKPTVPRTEPYLLIRRNLSESVCPQWIPYLFWDSGGSDSASSAGEPESEDVQV